MRFPFVVLLLGLPALALVNSVIHAIALKRFLAEVPRLMSSSDLERFKKMVAGQMYGALVQIVLLGAPLVVFLVGIVTKVLGPGDILLVVGPSLVILVAGLLVKPIEAQARTLGTDDPVLEGQRNAIVDTWLHRPFPDW